MRAGTLGAAAGVIVGLTAAVTLSFSRLLRDLGLTGILAHWQPWALIALGLAGVLLSQSAYQAGALAASLRIIDTLEPTTSERLVEAVSASGRPDRRQPRHRPSRQRRDHLRPQGPPRYPRDLPHHNRPAGHRPR